MQLIERRRLKRFGNRLFRILLCGMLLFQTLGAPNIAHASTAFGFRGYGKENVTNSTFTYGSSGASVSGTTVSFTAVGTGEAIGHIVLNEEDNDISTAIDLGGLEIDFSTVASTALEEENASEVDVASAQIKFYGDSDNLLKTVSLQKSNPSEAGSETLTSGASIPAGAREIFIYLYGTSVSGSNTVVFSNTSLVIHDSSAPSCIVEYNADWTNQPVSVRILAADSDSGLQGIYLDDALVSTTSPYEMVVSENNTSFSAYSMDHAGKKSDVQTITISNIDTTTPAEPASLSLSATGWTNADVSLILPELPESTGAPERYVYQIGASAWTDLQDVFTLSDNGTTTIRVAVADAAGNRSGHLQASALIDKLAPVIDTLESTVFSGSCRVHLTYHDEGLSELRNAYFAEGIQTADYFTTGGTVILDGTFTVSMGGEYTICILDNAGNATLQTITLSTAPTLGKISNETINEDTSVHIPLAVSDAESALEELSIRVTTDDETLIPMIRVNQSATEASIDLTPGANLYGGPATVTVVVEDPQHESVSDSFTVTVLSVNDAPVATDDEGISLDEDTFVTIDVLANDADSADGDSLSISSCGDAQNGTTLVVLDKIRYTPDKDFVGEDSFTYTVSDGNGGTATATVRVTVLNINDAPVALDDTASVSEDAAVTIPVMDNDSDVDLAVDPEETLAISDVSAGAHGATRIEGSAVIYTPEKDFFGSDSFTYTITDALGSTATATVTITVAPEADAPVFIDLEDAYTINEDTRENEIVFSIRDAETPADSLMLQAASMTTTKIAQSGISISGLGDNQNEVKILVTPVTNQYGEATILLSLGDGFTTVQRTITIHIKDVNDAPRVTTDTVTFDEGAAYVDISIAELLENDSDLEGNPLSFGVILTQPSSGEVRKLDGNTLRYMPEEDFDGETSFTYSVSDGMDTAIATCRLIANGINDVPTLIFTYDSAETTEDTRSDAIEFRISDKETSVADLVLIASSGDASIVSPDGISITNNGDGSGALHIMPQADANGTLTITLTVSDGEAQSSDTISLTVAPAPDAPEAEDDEIYVLYTSSCTFGVLDNDHDIDRDALSVVEHSATGLPGTLSFNSATQQFTYAPAVGENGERTFTYTVSDGELEDTATVTLHVESITHDPVISPINSQYVLEDGTISGIAFTVSDEDAGDIFEFSVASGDERKLVADLDHAFVSSLGEGRYTLSLTPVADSSGLVTVTVTVTDSAENRDTTTFTLHILAQNDAPVAANDTVELYEDSTAKLDLLWNDSDADGDNIWVTSVTTPAHGYLTRTNDVITYTPYAEWSGTESLTYSISDGRASAEATLNLSVLPVNDAPVAWSDYVELPNEIDQSASEINVIYNDRDPDGDTVHAYRVESQPRFGTASINPNGTIQYTRTAVSTNANGADSFTYSIIDRADEQDTVALTATATVYVGIDFVPSLNTYGSTITCYEDCDPFEFTLDVSNPTPVNYTLTINTPCTLGTLSVVPGKTNTVLFTPTANAYGYQTITYTVANAENTEHDTGTIWLTVYPVNDAPQIDSAPEEVVTQEDAVTPASFDVTFYDIDCDLTDLHFYVYTKSASTSAPIVFQTGYSVQNITGGKRVTVTPYANVNGSAVIVVGVSDGLTYKEQTIDLTVTPQDDAPILNDIYRTIKEDSSVRFAALPSDHEVDGDDTTVSIDTPAHGTAVLRADNTILYTPNANYYGTDTFHITVTDETETAKTATALVTIDVQAVNDQPMIRDLAYYQTTQEDTAKLISLTVIDVDNDMTDSGSYSFHSSDESVARDISIAHGTGNEMWITVNPVENASGTTLILVTATDGALSAKGAFVLNVTPVNDKPIAVYDEATVAELSTDGGAASAKTTAVMNLTENDTDVENGTLRIVAISNVQNGTVVNSGGGSVTVSAFNGDYYGDITFSYTVMDPGGETASANAKLIITPSNDPPRAAGDSITIDEDARPIIAVLENDSDPEDEALSIVAVSDPAHGKAYFVGSNVYYIPNKDYNGKDSFTYTVADASEATATATVSVTIRPLNDAPEIAKYPVDSGEWIMLEDTPKSFHFDVSDAESADSNLIIRICSQDESLIKTAQIQLATNAAGYKTIYVVPNTNAHGTVDIDFSVSDGLATTTVTYPITIQSVNDAPVVSPMQFVIKEDTALETVATATDADGDEVSFSLVEAHPPIFGSVTMQEDGRFVYTPDKDFNGFDLFEIAANDHHEENNIGTAYITVRVLPQNDPPTANDDSITILEDTPSEIDVLYNDTDEDMLYGDGDTLTILRISSAPVKGTATISEGKVLYTPALNQNGTDTFSYVVADQDGKLDSAEVTVIITPVNDAPENGNDVATTNEDVAISINVLENDDVDVTTNPELEHLTIIDIDQPTNGVISVNEGGQGITYTPKSNYFNTADDPDVFYYTVQDSGKPALSERFSVSVTVLPVNDAPTILAATESGLFANVTMDEDTVSGTIAFTVYDVEDPEEELTVTVTHDNSVLLPEIAATPNAEGACSFVIDSIENKVGTATITVRVTDKGMLSAEKTFTVTVEAVNDAPTPQNDAYSVAEGGSITRDVLINDDVDTETGNGGDTLSLLGFVAPNDSTVPTLATAYGTATVVDNKLVYTHTAKTADKTIYTDSFQYRMKETDDTSGNTYAATVVISITPYNDAPEIEIIPITVSIQEDTPNGTGEISFSVMDEEDDDDGLVIITKTSSNTTLVPLSNITITNPSNAIDSTGKLRTVKVIPVLNQFGTTTITLTVRDAEGRTATDSFTVTVTAVNDAPANGDDAVSVNEDTSITINVLENDDVDLITNPASEHLTITDYSQPENGTTTRSADAQKITYTPKANYFSLEGAPDTFTYTVRDSGNETATFTVSVTVLPVNDAPTIDYRGQESYTVSEGVAVENILFYIDDVDHNTDLSLDASSEVTVTAKSSNSILLKDGITLTNGEGKARYISLQPNGEWNGVATITITATDKAGAKATHRFTLEVTNVNKKPTAVADNLSVPEDEVTNVDVLENDTDPDLITNPGTERIYVNDVSTQSTNASVSVAVDGKSVVVAPIENFNGTFTFTYTIRDEEGEVSDAVVSTVTVTQVNDAPTPKDDTATTNEDTAKTINVLTNDTDVDSDDSLNAVPDYTKTVVGVGTAAHGTTSYTAGDVTYTPAANFNGTDSFTYTLSDGALTATATVLVTVNQVNDAPVAVKDVSNVDEDHAASMNVVANDTDVDTEADKNLAEGALQQLSDLVLTDATLTSGSGTVSRSGNTVTFTPTKDWFGQAIVTYTISDKDEATATGIYEINVASVNDLPLFDTPPANMSLVEDSDNGSSAMVVSDIETAASALNVTFRSSTNTALVDAGCVSITSSGNGNRLVTVNPKDDQNGTAQIELRVTDGNGGYKEHTFTVTVAADNDDPVAQNIAATTPEDTAKTIDVSPFISDVDIETNNDVLVVSVAEGNGPAHGSYSLSGTQITYTPTANFNGTDSITYTVTDKAFKTATAVISLTVTQVNDAPTPKDDTATTNEDTAKTIDVLTNDTDVDSDDSLNAVPDYTKTVVGVGTAAHGTTSYTAGDVTYTPAANFNGTDSFTYTLSDGALTATATVLVTVNQVNDAPVAVKDVSNVDEDHAASMNVVANDTDVDTEADKNLAEGALQQLSDLVLTDATLTSGSGTVSRSGNTVTFTPTKDWFGQAIVTYTISDKDEATATGIYEINVASVNDLPLFDTPPANMSLVEDSDNGSSGMVVSDIETAASALSVTFRSSTNTALVDAGCVSITSSGDENRLVTVNPKDNQNGTAQIELCVTDGNGGYKEHTFTVTVAADNDDPVAQNIAATTPEDTAKTIDVSPFISDVDIETNNDVLAVSVAEGNGPAHGSYSLSGTQITYTPTANFNGTDSITYTVTDKAFKTATAVISLTVTQVNDAPVPEDDEAELNEDTTKTINVLTNDTDVDSDDSLNAVPDYTKTVVGVGTAAHGTTSYTAGDVTYTPAANFNGTDSFTYTISDGALTATATVLVTVNQVNDAPTAKPDTTTTREDTPVTYNVLDNDEDVDTDPLLNLAEPLHLKSEFSLTGIAFSGDVNGAVSFSEGAITYTPDKNFVGTQVISYEMSDGHGGSSSSTLRVIVGSEDDAPIANDDEMNTTEDHAVTINVLDNDMDYDIGDTLQFAGFKGSVSTLPGTFETNANGTVTFTPRANYNGSFTVEYYVSDSTNLTDLATITVTVSVVNDAPVALDTEATTQEDTAKIIDVSSRISDVDTETNEDAIVVSVAEGNGPAHGAYLLSGTQITYTPQSNFNGTDQIVYTVTDSHGESDTGTISITILAVNDKPVALDDSAETNEDTPVTINVLENDTDVDTNSALNVSPDNALTIASVGAAAHGTARIVDGQITYQPHENFNGSDSFTYTVSDGDLSDTARVSVSIAQVNDGIVAQDDETSTTDEDPVEIDVLANDTDADTDEANNLDELHGRDDFLLTAVGAASNGTTKIENGKITYTPFDRFAGEDSFSYTVADGHGTSDSATVTVTVLSVNDAPMIIEVSKPAEGTKAIPPDAVSVVWTAFDIDGDTLTYSLEYFDGKSWLPAATGLTKPEYAFAIPSTLASTSGLKFRVTANDGSLTSDYGYSGAVKVDKDAPTGSIVSMRTADGRAYTAGTWTNQNVTVQASGAQDASAVAYYYAMDGAAEEAANSMTVTGGVRTVSVTARDEFGNQTALGGYLARVDKQSPAVPQMRESISDANVLVSFSLLTDPGGSGNAYLILPDGSTLNAGGALQFATAKNGTYSFTLVDVAGNRRTFSYTVSSADTTKPQIGYASGAYRVGTSSTENISVTLTFTDSESAIVARGYQLSQSASASGAYRSYSGAIVIDKAGTYYIHAFARNAFDNAAYETFGPFILVNEAATLAGATPTPEPKNGNIIVTKEDVEEKPGETVAIRLPGKEWSETLTLEDVSPGDYLVEVMDADGNVRTVTVHVTAQDIIARSLKSSDSPAPMIALAIAAAAGLLLLLLFAGYNVTVTIVNMPFTQEKKIRAMRRIMFAREEFVIKLEQRHIQGGRFARIRIAKHLTKKLRGSWIIVQLQGAEVLREQVPEDANEPFRRKITLE